ncbi:MAG: anaerobic ribonucleoside-triphosphate reductase activating protein [Candidatus Ornithomonoglobus sp.]
MRYHNITKDDMLNGDGLRVVLWTAGCEHRCPGCQNPVTWDINGGLEFDKAAKEELFGYLAKPYISGITFSGGDPLLECRRDEMTALVAQVRERFPDKTIWMYTGYKWKDVKNLSVIKMLDVLVDGRFVEAKKDTTLSWRGSSNQHVIDVQKSLNLGKMVLHCE